MQGTPAQGPEFRMTSGLQPATSTPVSFRTSATLLALPLLGLSCTKAGSNPAPTGAVAPVTVKIIALNDFHGNLEVPQPWKTNAGPVPSGGVAYLAAHVAKLRAANPHSVVVSAGDLVGASPLVSGLFHDEPTIEAMNLIGLDINGVGNHEFDEGLPELLRMQAGGCHPKDGCQSGHDFKGSTAKFLAANVIDEHSGKNIFPPYDVRDMGGVPVAFIGMTLENTPAFVPPVVQGLKFLDEAETVNHLMKKLKAEGIEAFVVVLHEGGFIPGDYDECGGLSGPIVDVLKRLDKDVDLVITGHTHQAYNCLVDGLRVTSAGCYGRLVTDIDLTLDPKSKDVIQVEAKNVLVTHDVEQDASLVAVVEDYVKRAAPLAKRPIGELAAPIPTMVNEDGEAPLGSLIADAQLWATEKPEDGGAHLAFMNTGGIRVGLEKPGVLAYEDLFAVHPFGNTLVTLTLTGAQIHRALEEQWGADRTRFLQPSHTLKYVWQPDAPAGQHVPLETLTLGGAPLVLDKPYRVTLNNYLAGRGVFKEGTDPQPGVVDVDALVAYVKAQSPVQPVVPGRIKKAP